MENYNDDDDISLPADTLKILQQFLDEKAKREKIEADSVVSQEHNVEFEENWQLSQFWYSEGTKRDLTKLVANLIVNADDSIALLSCPSLYKSIKTVHKNTKIFEFDERFSAYGSDFIFFDFNKGSNSNYLIEYENKFDIIVADPPFLSKECIEKMSNIIKRLSKDKTKIIFCSGEVVEPWLIKYLDLKKYNYKPEHNRNLGNEFVSYANFNLDETIKC